MSVWTNVNNLMDNYKSRGIEASSVQEAAAKKSCPLADIRKWVTLAISSGTLQHALLEGNIEGMRNRGRPRPMWMGNKTEWSGFGYEEATRQELLVATHCIRPTNGWNLTTTAICSDVALWKPAQLNSATCYIAVSVALAFINLIALNFGWSTIA